MEPLVSVNLCTYNRAHLLPRSLKSILNQSYTNMEIIIVDDCSSDETEALIKSWQLKDDRIKYIKHKKNKHLAVARNTAWKSSRGKYIAFMDDDDEWIDIHKLKNQVKIFENSSDDKLGLICGSVRLFSNENTYKDKIVTAPKNLIAHILARNGILYTPTVMIKKSVLNEIGGFDEKMRRGVDGECYRTCIVKYGYHVKFVKDITTAIHEYGSDRITPKDTIGSIRISLKANIYLLIKYRYFFIVNPKSALYRFKIITKIFINYARLLV